ncbi:MAG: 50S ribosome-binding GTPase, partial [Caulobacteraceae bacterium]|nr:50S ribosome-binding GTPase [Caulobacteraceae bacterium]
TLFNRLTDSEVEARDMLFATLDPTLRAIRLPQGRPAVLSDTVGFISDLPHELVEAFRATLEEVAGADVVVHVRDIASPDTEAQAADVRAVLEQIGAGADSGKVIVEVWNKVDLLSPDDRVSVTARALRTHDQGGIVQAVAVSAVSGEGIERLLMLFADLIDHDAPVRANLAPGDGQALAWLYRHGRILSRDDDPEGRVHLSVRLDHQALGRFESLFPHALVGLAAE